MNQSTLTRLWLSVLLLCGAALPLQAQYAMQTPPASNMPWNNYVAATIPNSFNSIIGQIGTTLVSGSTGQNFPYEWRIPLQFQFNFLGVNYPAGYNILASMSGYVAFNNPPILGGNYYPYLYYQTSNLRGYYNKVIWVYSADLTTTPSQAGIYWRTDGPIGNRVQTIEWRVQGISQPAGNPGNFQLKLYESPSGKMEFLYGPNSINRTEPSPGRIGYGALVGIKNLGQGQGVPAGNDAEKFVILQNPKTNPDTLAITRVPTINYVGVLANYPILYAYYPSYAPPTFIYRSTQIWHYEFPTKDGQQIGYRLSPVFDDVAADSIWFTPERLGSTYLGGSSITVNGTFLNVGKNVRQNVPVQAKVYRDQDLVNPVLTLDGTAFITGAGQGQKSTIVLGQVTPPVTDITGIYTVKIYSRLTSPMDQDFNNDTLTGQFSIAKPNDVRPWAILQPYENKPPLNYQYPVGVGVPVEVRFLNAGFNTQVDVPVGYEIRDNAGTMVYSSPAIVPGQWTPATFRDLNLNPWVPTRPGRYYLKVMTNLSNDENRLNDTLPNWKSWGQPFDVNYEIELEALLAGVTPHSPMEFQSYPDGRLIPVSAGFRNNGLADATNVPATVVIKNEAGQIVYSRTATILTVPSGGAPMTQEFPSFIPNGSGQYCLTVTVNDPQDPVTENNTATWCFNVKARYAGVYRVGFGEHFRTIQEAWDSVSTYGVGGPVTMELVDDSYTVQPSNNDPSQPALDMRGDVVGLSAANPLLWRAVAGKSNVTINLKSPSGVGIWYGQKDTANPSGYVTWDGGTNKVLRFVVENTTATNVSGYKRLAIPFYLGQGASNYKVLNSRIEPWSGNTLSLKNTASTISLPSYNQSFNTFTFVDDLAQVMSAGVMLRNSAPVDGATGTNSAGRDTLRNQNNEIRGNVIRDFAVGIASIGAGPLYVVGPGAYIEYTNQNNQYTSNQIWNSGRGGVVLVYEKNSVVSDNWINGVANTSQSIQHGVGISITSGGNGSNNRGYSSDLTIERNRIANISTVAGISGGIVADINENVFVSPSNRTYRFPANGASNLKMSNNMIWNYCSGTNRFGIAITPEATSRIDFVMTGNQVNNNTIYNTNSCNTQAMEIGIWMNRAQGSVQNNIVALTGNNTPTALRLVGPELKTKLTSNHNVLWAPNGMTGSLQNLSSQGYNIPSPPAATSLNQWRYLTGMDMNSMQGDITQEFVSTWPGNVDLHIQPMYRGSIANNRGTKVSGLTNDIDMEPRGSAALNGRYDIGADEFTGHIRNNDVMAEDILGPVGYRASSGQFGDAEYIMVDTSVSLVGRLRNVGGQPVASNAATMTVQRWTGTTWVTVATMNKSAGVDVSEQRNIAFGMFMPQTLRELGQSDPYYGQDPNVSPLYRLQLRSGTDDNITNNRYEKIVRFYVLRATRRVLVSVESYQPGNPSNSGITDPVVLGNKLNADSVVSALNQIVWDRTNGLSTEDFDIFQRDMWPKENLDFRPWKTIIWSQGEEGQGLEAEERAALKGALDSRTMKDKTNLLMAGQEVARKHDVVLTASNGQIADKEFVNNYLRATYAKPTQPANYSGLRLKGIALSPNKYEMVQATGVVNDLPPMPAILKVTVNSDGVAKPSHQYIDLPPVPDPTIRQDTTAGVASKGVKKQVVYYAFDWRHAGRFWPEPTQSGVKRLVLAGLDFFGYNTAEVLPIKLSKFDAQQTGRRQVTVEWLTSGEENVSAMEIQRAEVKEVLTGEVVGEFAVVDRQAGRGTATVGAEYRTVDGTVEGGRTYVYRLVTVNTDGTVEINDQRQVKVSGEGIVGVSVAVLPNPMVESGSVMVELAEGGMGRIAMYDASGKEAVVVYEGGLSVGTTEYSIPVSELSSGVYTVRVELKGGASVVKTVVVQK